VHIAKEIHGTSHLFAPAFHVWVFAKTIKSVVLSQLKMASWRDHYRWNMTSSVERKFHSDPSVRA
jgi:hypothetical protein